MVSKQQVAFMNAQHDRAEEPVPTRAYGGLSSEERRQLRRERLMEAGLEVFGRRGLSQSTMRDICTRARLSDRYFYESFANVQDVFEAIYVQQRDELLVRLQGTMKDVPPDPIEITRAGLRIFFSFVQEDPRRARIMLIDVLGLRYSHLGDDSDEHTAVYRADPYVSMYANALRAMYPVVDKLGIDLELIYHTMIGMTVQSATAWADQGFDKSVDDIVRHNMFAWEGLATWIKRLVIEHMAAESGSKPVPPKAAKRPAGARRGKNAAGEGDAQAA